MKRIQKGWKLLVLTIVLGFLLSACTNNNNESEENAAAEPELSTEEMVDEMVAEIEEPAFMELEDEQVEGLYGIDVDMLEEYTIKIPMMNVKTNEIAIMKVKDEADLTDIKEIIEQRAENVQRQFEHYLPDQYENAKNYKLETNGKYVVFIISENADKLLDVYESFFE